MQAWFRKQIEPFGFRAAKKHAWRVSAEYPFLFHSVSLSKNEDGYAANLTIGMADPYRESGCRGLDTTNNYTLYRTAVLWGPVGRQSEFSFTNVQKHELLDAFQAHALPWFDKWADPHLLINFYRWKMGEDIGPQGKEFQLGGDICDGKPSIANLSVVALIYAHLGQFDQASRYINQVKIIPQINPWVEKARADFAAGHIQAVDLREALV